MLHMENDSLDPAKVRNPNPTSSDPDPSIGVPSDMPGITHAEIVRGIAGGGYIRGIMLEAQEPNMRAAQYAVYVLGTWQIGYTVFQAHLGELVIRLGQSHALAEDRGWRIVRAVVDEVYDRAGPDAHADHAAFTAPVVPHKALVRMRLAGAGDEYLLVQNPLHAPA